MAGQPGLVQLGLVAASYACLILFGLMSSIALGVAKGSLHGKCFLYASAEKVNKFIYIHESPASRCDYVIGVNVIFGVLCAASMLAFLSYVIHKVRRDVDVTLLQHRRYSLVQLVVHLCVAFLCLVASSMTSAGFSGWCASLTQQHKAADLTCKETSSFFSPHFKSLYNQSVLTEVTSWCGTVLWLLLSLYYALSFYRLARTKESSRGIYNPAPGVEPGARF